MKVILSHPTGNANVRAAASGLNDCGILYEFHTAIASFPGTGIDSLGSLRPFSELRKRTFDQALQARTRMWPWLEMARLLSKKLGFTGLTKHETGLLSVDAVYRAQDRRTASRLKSGLGQNVRGIYAYEDGAEYSFEQAKVMGITRLYDLPIGYWRSARKLLELENERRPEWAPTLNILKDSEAKLARKDKEIELADCIFVASSFTAGTLKDFPGKLPPVKVIPYGFPPVGAPRDYTFHKEKRPLRLLFVGGLSQRKGIADLFEAADNLGSQIELTVVGKSNSLACPALDSALTKHRWIPGLSHPEVLKLMRETDVLVFPSLFEGFGLVITEAMSQGTPVITTERTAGPDLIVDGKNGWLIKAGSPGALQRAVERLLVEPEAIEIAGRNAMETAGLRPWSAYRSELADAVKNFLLIDQENAKHR